MRRLAPRPLRAALEEAVGEAAPQDLLALAQGVWPEVAGEAVAGESQPVSQRAGTITVACRSAVWRQELELLGPELLERLNARLAGAGSVTALRFRTGSGELP